MTTAGTILVTGASGMLGSAVVRSAVAQGCSVVGTHHDSPITLAGRQTVSLTLEEPAALESAVRRIAPAAVSHCAALTNVDHCERHPDEAFAVNAAATGLLARAAARCGARFLYVSTDAVFDGERGWYTESDTCRPVNVYAASKHRGEENALAEHATAVVVRLAPFGWSVRPGKRSLAEWVLAELQDGRSLSGFTDAVFTPMYQRDLAPLLIDLVRASSIAGIYHLGSRDAVSKFEFARIVAETAGFSPDLVHPVSIRDHPFRAPRPLDVSLSTSKVSRDLGRRMPVVRDGIASLLRDAPDVAAHPLPSRSR
jgi:dTDP-4-dehydrorhamnose reductase